MAWYVHFLLAVCVFLRGCHRQVADSAMYDLGQAIHDKCATKKLPVVFTGWSHGGALASVASILYNRKQYIMQIGNPGSMSGPNLCLSSVSRASNNIRFGNVAFVLPQTS
jgi:hypothetical protein